MRVPSQRVHPVPRLSSSGVVATLVAGALALLISAPGRVGAQDAVRSRVVVQGLEFPAGMAFLDDGSLVVNERGGVVNLVRDGSIEKIAEIPTTTDGETGLLGAAAAPDAVYVFATEPDGETNTVWRVPIDGGDPRRIVSGLPAAVYHNGGGVAFGEDGMLYVSNGEQHDDGRAQDPEVLGGKVYRFTPEGEVPSDNPFPDSPAFALGLRNPYGLAIDPLSGNPWVTENGPSSYDEINVVTEGSNLGWPLVSGPASANGNRASGLDGYRDPVLAYENIIVPTGIAFAGSDGGDVAAGDLFFATYGEGTIHHVRLDESRTAAESDEVIFEAGEPVIALAWGPDGLYYSTTTSIGMLELAAEPRSSSESPPASPLDASGRGSPDAEDGPSGALITTLVTAVALLALIVGLILWRRRP